MPGVVAVLHRGRPEPPGPAVAGSTSKGRRRGREPARSGCWPRATCASSASRSPWSSPSRATWPRTGGADRPRHRPARRPWSTLRGLAREAPHVVHPERGSNVERTAARRSTIPTSTPSSSGAAHVVTETFGQHRYMCVPMETRGLVATGTRSGGELTVDPRHPGPARRRGPSSPATSACPRTRIRVIMGDVGGGFGQKMFPMPEEIAVAVAARGRAPPGQVDRGPQGEPHVAASTPARTRPTVCFAVDGDGTPPRAPGPTWSRTLGDRSRPPAAALVGFAAMLFPGPYRIPRYGASRPGRVHQHLRALCLPGPVDDRDRRPGADDGPRRPPSSASTRWSCGGATWSRTRTCPTPPPTGMVYDQITAAATLEQAAEMIGYDGVPRRTGQAWREEGRLVGIGISLFVEPSAIAMGSLSHRGGHRAGRDQRPGRRGDQQRQPRPEPRDDHRPGGRRRAGRRRRRRHASSRATPPPARSVPGTGGSRSAVLGQRRGPGGGPAGAGPDGRHRRPRAGGRPRGPGGGRRPDPGALAPRSAAPPSRRWPAPPTPT